MKPIKKKTAKLFIALIVVAAVIGSIFAFVPMNFGKTQFNSVFGDRMTLPEALIYNSKNEFTHSFHICTSKLKKN